GQAVALEGHAAAVGWGRGAHRVALLLGDGTHGLRLQSAGARLKSVRRARPLDGLASHLVGEGAETADLALLALGQPGPASLVEGPGRAVLRVGAAVLDEAALVEMQHAREGAVEKGYVVAHDQQGPAIGDQEANEPRLGVVVE